MCIFYLLSTVEIENPTVCSLGNWNYTVESTVCSLGNWNYTVEYVLGNRNSLNLMSVFKKLKFIKSSVCLGIEITMESTVCVCWKMKLLWSLLCVCLGNWNSTVKSTVWGWIVIVINIPVVSSGKRKLPWNPLGNWNPTLQIYRV